MPPKKTCFTGTEADLRQVLDAMRSAPEDASVLFLQRRFKWSYNKAATAMDELERRGDVAKRNGYGPRRLTKGTKPNE